MKNSLSKKNIYLKNISEYLVLWAVGGCIYYGIEVLFRGFSHISMFMLGGLCMQFFTWQGRLTEWQDALPRQITRCTICCEYGIYHWNYRKQMVSPGSLGLFGYAIAVMGADLSSLCAYFFFFMYYGYPSVRISASLVL